MIAANILEIRLYNSGGRAVVVEDKSRMRDASRVEEESEEADAEEEGTWPQLMIHGCGKLKAIYL